MTKLFILIKYQNNCSIDFSSELQKIPQYFAVVFDKVLSKGFDKIKVVVSSLKLRSTNMKKNVILYLKTMDVRLKTFGRLMTDFVYQVKGTIDLIADRYHKYLSQWKRRSALFREKLYLTLKAEVMEFVDNAKKFLLQYEVVNYVVLTYNTVLIWIEENNILKKIEENYENIKR